jgi:hypothetical protein
MHCPFKTGDTIEEISIIQWHFDNSEKNHTKVYPTGRLATVTRVTKKGFKYRYHEPYVMHPRLGLVDAGECYEGGFSNWRKVS